MFAARRLLITLRQPVRHVRCSHNTLPARRTLSSTFASRAEVPKTTPPQDPEIEDIPEDILEELDDDVHDEMSEVGKMYGEELGKFAASPDAAKALQEMKETAQALGVYWHALQAFVGLRSTRY
jgi:hypothetical protein